MKSILYKSLYLIIATLVILTGSCTDDLLYYDGEIPEGEGTLSATVTFTPITSAALGSTRTDGDAMNNIRVLSVLVYTTDGNLFKCYSSDSTDPDSRFTYTVGEYNVNQDKDHLDGNEAHTDETTTAKATFSLDNLPFGLYRIYAVVNMDDLTDNYSEDIKTEEGLKNISLKWNPNVVTDNDQMFGYFTPADNMESEGFNAQTITFVKPQTSIHAWLKRAASKVTVAFDPSGLNQGVTVYIRNVTIRDIPTTCPLGAENRPSSVEELYNHLSTPYQKPDFNTVSDAIANSRFEYNNEGLITDPNEHTGNTKTDGFVLTNHIREAVPEGAHATDAPSLFFYENNQQPDYDNMSAEEKKRYDKKQQHSGEADGVGTPIRDNENDNDFKDRVPFGTYIEVEAYYISSNPQKVGEGSIKYRFMLGKDTDFDYNAQRNYHYKLTLGFNGWANDPDWHIDYELPSPGLEVPPVFRVSYLYHQMSELPIRILGDCVDLKVEIEENNWAPYDPTSRNPWPVPNAETAQDPDPVYAFKWNYEAFTNSEYMNDNKNMEYPYFGFLALHLPDRATTTISESFSADANLQLKKYYENNKEGVRSFSAQDLTIGTAHSQPGTSVDDQYDVIPVTNDLGTEIPNQKTLLLPLWTRAKTLINGSGFSGNNPYEGYERKATLKITAKFSDGTEILKEVTVLQVKRIVNPKGVWRAHNSSNAFNVTLLETVNANGMSDFQPFISEGEWTAYIDGQTNAAGFSLSVNGQTDGYKDASGMIHGYTGSTINFTINFGTSVGENESQCAIVKVLYHGNQCLHKILIRKGYNAPIELGGHKWSSFSLYQASATDETEGGREVYDAVLTKNPLMLGSMFRRGKLDQGIFVWNNTQPGLGPDDPPGNTAFVIGRKKVGVTIKPGLTDNAWKNQWQAQTWSNIGYRNDLNKTDNCGVFYALDDDGNYTKDESGNRLKYRVPTYEEFSDLTNSSEFGFGVFYGSAATAPKTTANEAYGLIDPYNEGLFDSENGMRAVVVYDRTSGDQIVFPMGRYGMGTRRMFNVTNLQLGSSYSSYYGNLHYSDVYKPLTIDLSNPNNKNLYRPVPYNLPIVGGCIYWVDQYVAAANTSTGDPCLGWDINYFNFDFNPYTANNYRDACPIKFILVE